MNIKALTFGIFVAFVNQPAMATDLLKQPVPVLSENNMKSDNFYIETLLGGMKNRGPAGQVNFGYNFQSFPGGLETSYNYYKIHNKPMNSAGMNYILPVKINNFTPYALTGIQYDFRNHIGRPVAGGGIRYDLSKSVFADFRVFHMFNGKPGTIGAIGLGTRF